jgi:hypothetical protein
LLTDTTLHVSVGKTEGKTTLGRPRRRWEDGSIMDLRETDWGNAEWSVASG